MKVYIAGTMHDPRISLGLVQQRLEMLGHEVVSRWHIAGNWKPNADQNTPEARATIAMDNFGDIDRSNVVLVVPCEGHHMRGAHVEVGYAIGTWKTVYVLGAFDSVNTMCTHPRVEYIGDLEEIK